jgi:hypothetical protein
MVGSSAPSSDAQFFGGKRGILTYEVTDAVVLARCAIEIAHLHARPAFSHAAGSIQVASLVLWRREAGPAAFRVAFVLGTVAVVVHAVANLVFGHGHVKAVSRI